MRLSKVTVMTKRDSPAEVEASAMVSPEVASCATSGWVSYHQCCCLICGSLVAVRFARSRLGKHVDGIEGESRPKKYRKTVDTASEIRCEVLMLE